MKLQKFNRTLLGAMVITGAMGIASQAQAAAGYCDLGTATEGISTANMTFNSIAASDCYGVVAGNISGTGNGGNDGPAELNALLWGTGWSYLDATDAAGSLFMGLSFTVTATPGTTGSWTLTGTDTNGGTPLNFPTSLDFVVSLKGGTEYALWGFDNATVDGSDTGTFSIVFTNNGGNNPALSHLIVYAREAGGGSVTSVPEASTYGMMLAGLGLVGFAVRRKQA
jgi:hypothetical protein